MLVKEAVAELLQLPQDHEIMNEYGEEILTRFYVSDYDDSDGRQQGYVAYDTMEVTE
jgi:hypothetical protein